MSIIFCTMKFRYWDSEVNYWMSESVHHAFYRHEDIAEWRNDLSARAVDARQQAIDFEPNGVPDSAEDFELMEFQEMLVELT